MARTIPNPEPAANGSARKLHVHEPAGGGLAAVGLWGDNPLAGDSGTPFLDGDGSELDQLRRENAELRSIIAELHEHAEAGGGKAAEEWARREKEYEALLEEKSELIRGLHVKVKDLDERRPPATPKEEELLALSEELERERCRLEQERKQLEADRQQLAEDEQIMTQQMREMEVQMARERADFARQRSELQRLHDEIRRELERMERNGSLNQRLGQLRQRYQDVSAVKGATPDAPPAAPPAEAAKKKDGKFLRGLFR